MNHFTRAATFCVGMFVALTNGLSLTAAGEQHGFLKITNPREDEKSNPGEKLRVSGLLLLPDPGIDPDLLFIRLRVYRAANRSFVIDAEALAQPKKPPVGKKLHTFEATVKTPKVDGVYLLKVDCFEFKISKDPNYPIASQSIFIKLQSANEAPVSQSVTINRPKAFDIFSTGSNINVNGVTTRR